MSATLLAEENGGTRSHTAADLRGAGSRGKMNRSMLASDRQDWNTPEGVIDRVRAFDAIGLDPCSNAGAIVGASTEWRLERDGDSLTRDWRGHGVVFVNPPYGPHLLRWMAKCAASGAEVITLTPARTDTKWWQNHAARASAICYWRGRITFRGARDPAPFPTASCYFGERVDRFVEVFKPAGLVQVSANLIRYVAPSPQLDLPSCAA